MPRRRKNPETHVQARNPETIAPTGRERIQSALPLQRGRTAGRRQCAAPTARPHPRQNGPGLHKRLPTAPMRDTPNAPEADSTQESGRPIAPSVCGASIQMAATYGAKCARDGITRMRPNDPCDESGCAFDRQRVLPSTSEIVMTAGPRSTTKIAGKMQNISGKISFTGAANALSCAR